MNPIKLGSFENEALENEDRSTTFSKLPLNLDHFKDTSGESVKK